MTTIINTNCIPDSWNPDDDKAFNNWLNKIATERAEHYKVQYQTVE